MTYTLDTNILIALRRHYPRDLFPSLWSAIEDAIADGTVCICRAVLNELENDSDDLHKWAKELNGFVCEVAQSDADVAAEISVKYPGWVRETKNAADPWLVAHGNTHGRVVVSDEKLAGSNVSARNMKVPNVAAEWTVRAIRFFEWVREEGWAF